MNLHSCVKKLHDYETKNLQLYTYVEKLYIFENLKEKKYKQCLIVDRKI